MRIGIDFDNTIVCYDQLFWTLARDRELIALSVPRRKDAVRDHLREHGLEPIWTKLQGEAYGPYILDAEPFPGVIQAFEEFRRWNWTVFVVSHKTHRPLVGEPHDLHAAARQWLVSSGLVDPQRSDLTLDHVYLEITKQHKLQRISELNCDLFIDDLPELLMDVEFPSSIQRVLFDPHRQFGPFPGIKAFHEWSEVVSVLTSEVAR